MPDNFSKWINKFEIKEGKWVYVPSSFTKNEGVLFVEKILTKWTPPDYFFHFKAGGHLTAIKTHMSNQYFSRLDIQNFFGSITASRITRCLKGYVGYALAREIAKKSTVRIPRDKDKKVMLPFGFVQSALLASVCLDKSSLGVFLKKVSMDSDFNLSVYMDDILISSKDREKLERVSDDIKNYFLKSHWVSNKSKEVIAEDAINAFNINLSYESIEVDSKRFEKFLENFSDIASEKKKNGIFSYVNSVNKNQANMLLGKKTN